MFIFKDWFNTFIIKIVKLYQHVIVVSCYLELVVWKFERIHPTPWFKDAYPNPYRYNKCLIYVTQFDFLVSSNFNKIKLIWPCPLLPMYRFNQYFTHFKEYYEWGYYTVITFCTSVWFASMLFFTFCISII